MTTNSSIPISFCADFILPTRKTDAREWRALVFRLSGPRLPTASLWLSMNGLRGCTLLAASWGGVTWAPSKPWATRAARIRSAPGMFLPPTGVIGLLDAGEGNIGEFSAEKPSDVDPSDGVAKADMGEALGVVAALASVLLEASADLIGKTWRKQGGASSLSLSQ